MKTELKAKFIQHLLGKKKEGEGFTLIELLVVIIIIGILSAIALPSFLSQANKAKQSEAKTYIGSLNKGQQASFTELGKFQSDISALGVGIKTGTLNYTYYTTAQNNTGTGASGYSYSSLVNSGSGLKNYTGKVSLVQAGAASDVTSIAIMCETSAPGAAATEPTSGSACATGSVGVGG